MKTPTKRATRRIAASIAIATALATSGAWAANPTWTGATNSYWSEPGNWDNANGEVPTSGWIMFESITDSSKLTVVITNAVTCTGGLQMNNIGTSENPLTFRADPSTASLQFGASSSTMIANYDGDSYVLLESGSYSTGGKVLYLGPDSAKRTFSGHLIVDSNASLTVEDSCQFSQASSIENRGEIETKNIRMLNVVSGKTSTFIFNGGTLKAAAAGTLVAASDYLTVNATANGGTIDAAGYNVTIAEDLDNAAGATGKMTFKGGGVVTLSGAINYTGKTAVTPGTILAVASSTAKANILANGLVVAGIPTAGQTILTYTSELTASDYANVTCPLAPGTEFDIGEDDKSIVVKTVGTPLDNYWTGAVDNDLSNDANWSSGTKPTGNANIFCATPATLTNSGDFAPDTVTIPDDSAVVTLAGALTVNCLTNASRLAVASTGSLTVDGDIVVCDGKGTFLNSNEGTVTVSGNAVCMSGTTAKQYDVVTANTNPMRVGGFVFHRDAGRAYFRLESNSEGPGAWVVGANGFRYQSDLQYSEVQWRYFAQANPVTLYSSANWTLRNSGRDGTTKGDLNVFSNSSLTINTSDYDDPTSAHTVTLEGRIMAEGPVTVTGCGTLEIATTGSHESLAEDYKHTYITNGVTLAVTDSATLKVNAGKKILGEGAISLAAGTTLDVSEGDAAIAGALAMSAGSTLKVPSLNADAAPLTVGSLTASGRYVNLVVNGDAGQSLAAGTYKIVACTNGIDSIARARFTTSSFTLPAGCVGTFSIVDDTLVYVVAEQSLARHGVWAGNSGSFGDAGNWEDLSVPAAGEAVSFAEATEDITVSFGDSADVAFGAATMGDKVVTFSVPGGKVKFASISDTSKVAVGENTSVTLDGDLVFASPDNEEHKVDSWIVNTVAAGGEFVVAGRVETSADGVDSLCPMVVPGEGVIVAKGLANYSSSLVDPVVYMVGNVNIGIEGYEHQTNRWVVGEAGIVCKPRALNAFYQTYRAYQRAEVQCDASDFSILAQMGVRRDDVLAFNTTGRDGLAHTITVGDGTVNAGGFFMDGVVEFSGAGTVVVDYSMDNIEFGGRAERKDTKFLVKDSVTLALKADANVGSGGRVTMERGTTLALPDFGEENGSATIDGLFAVQGESGTVTVRLGDGSAALAKGRYVVLTAVTLDGAAEDFAMENPVADGLSGAFEVSGGTLVYAVVKPGEPSDGMGGSFAVQESTNAKLPDGAKATDVPDGGNGLSYAQLDALGLLEGDGTFTALAITSISFNAEGAMVVETNAAKNDDYATTLYLIAADEPDSFPTVTAENVESVKSASGEPGQALVDESEKGVKRFYKVMARITDK